jgi:hypothetical protein
MNASLFKQLRVALPALAFFATLSPTLQAQCATGNSTCIGTSGDCQGQKFPSSTYGAGTVEFMSGVLTSVTTFQKYESFNGEEQESGKLEQNTNLTYVRQGAESVKCSIWKPLTGDSARAELGDGGIGLHPKKDASGNDYYYWYGWSYFIPNNSNWSSPTMKQFIGQWRFYNLNSCVTMKYCDGSTVGGSGHELLYIGGDVVLRITTSDTSCATSGRLKQVEYNLGPAAKGQWMDFMVQARWTETGSGVFNVWIQKNNGGYTQALAYTGATWIKTYNTATSCQFSGQETTAPGWQLGLYWSNERPATEATARFLYVDAARCNRTLCSTGKNSEAWTKTLPAAEGSSGGSTKVVELETLSYTTSSADTMTTFADATYASNGSAIRLNANATSDYAQTSFSMPTAGTYNVKVRGKRYTSRGVAALFVNGTQLGTTWDQYSTAANDWIEKDYGSVALVAGTNTFKWVMTGKNTSSTGFDYTLDKITLTP